MATIVGNGGNNTLIGTIDDDLIQGLAGDDILEGREGNDTLEGGNNNDILYGQDGNDSLSGGSGNDILDPGLGFDVVDGGVGTDTLTADYTNLNYFSNGAYNTTDGFYSRFFVNDRFVGYSNIEKFNIKGTQFDDDFLVRANDIFDGGAGSDYLRLNLATATTTVSVNLVQSTNQVVFGSTQVSNFERVGFITTGSGDDSIILGEAGSTSNGDVNGGAGNDTLSLDFTNVNYFNNGVYNYIGGGADGIYSRTFVNDRFIGYSNIEKFNIKGTQFDDDFIVKADEVFDGAGGSDILSLDLSTATTTVTVDLTQTANQVTYNTTQVSNFERIGNTARGGIATGSGDDSITLGGAGSASNGDVNGGAGNDTLSLDFTNLNYFNNGVYNYADGTFDGIYSRTFVNDRFIGYSNIEKFNIKGTQLDDDFIVKAEEVFDGAGGSDILNLDFATATTTVTVDLTQVANQVTYNTTQVSNFERIGNTARGGIVTGSGDDNITLGEAGSASNGDVDGGAGNDTLSLDFTNLNYFNNGVYSYADGTFDGIYSRAFVNDRFIGYSNIEKFDIKGTQFDDDLSGAADNDTLYGQAGNDILRGLAGSDLLYGEEGNDTLEGGDGNDLLDGGLGSDSMSGGAGNDTYIVNAAGDVITEAAAAGTDLVQSSVSHTLSANVENLTLTGTGSINGTGNSLNNTIIGNSGNNTLRGDAGNDILDGGLGADTLIGGTGDDTYLVDNVADIVTETSSVGIDTVQASVSYTLSANVENLTLTGSAAINGTGNSLSNVITGNSGNNILDGSTGADTLIGGAGNDTYIVDDAGDVVTETGVGVDIVQSSVNYTLTANVENLTLTGIVNLNGTGNNLANVITGNTGRNILNGGGGNDTLTGDAGNDTLNGGSGNDILIGGIGNDIYVIDSLGDVVTEAAGEGTDTIQTSFSYVLSDGNIENLTLTGSDNLNGTGNASNNVITGNSGNNILDGGLGADTLVGGAGNDTYLLDNAADSVTEAADAGTDTVQVGFSYTLGANLENLTLSGSANIDGTGNALSNTITGNSGNNILNGGAGHDTLIGGLGDDTYVVDSTGDVVTEAAASGTDTVQSSATYTLAVNVENLTLTGSGAINAIGNAGNNILIGNSGNNTLNGSNGNDTMSGGLGNDLYFVGSVGDVVIELAGEGVDRVQSTISYSLGAEVENLTLSGAAALSGTGNSLANTMTGNTGNNTLDGGAGNDKLTGGSGDDILIGGSGNDRLTGGAGADQLLYSTGSAFTAATVGSDTIIGFSSADLDKIVLSKATFAQLTSDVGAGFSNGTEFAVVATDTAAATSSALIVYNSVNGRLFYNQNGSAAGLGSGQRFATLNGFPALAAADFQIVA